MYRGKITTNALPASLLAFVVIIASFVSTFDLNRGRPRHLQFSRVALFQSPSPIPTARNSTDTFINDGSGYDDDPQHQSQQMQLDNDRLRRIPYEQRVAQPRLARRMNHPFKYLFRHAFDETVNAHTSATLDMEDPYTFLHIYGQYSHEQIQQMNASFPMLLKLSVRQQLYPKLLFLKFTMLQQSQVDPPSISTLVPPHYYGSRLERIIAPRHAFLVWTHLPNGLRLLEPMNADKTINESSSNASRNMVKTVPCKFHEFLFFCRNSKQFAVMCQKWANESGNNSSSSSDITATTKANITAKDIEAFDMIFGRGLLSICRNDLVQDNNTWATDQLQQKYIVRAADFIPILITHGSNVYERDHRGASLLHWACGTGHIDIVQQLLPYFDVTNITATRDGATVLHWSAAGCNTREFGIGGHAHICEFLIDHIGTSSSSVSVYNFLNQCTYDGNSPLMWAAWSGTIETVKLLVRNKASTALRNRNGCSVAHWAASGGNIEVCRYLHNVANVDFTVTNDGGNTPLSHAVAFGRTAVVEWLLQIIDDHNQDKMLVYSLAQDFVKWTDGDEKQKRSDLLQQFDDNGWI